MAANVLILCLIVSINMNTEITNGQGFLKMKQTVDIIVP